MSATPAPTQPTPSLAEQRRWAWMPRWLRPDTQAPDGRGPLFRPELLVIIAVALLLAVATVNDLVRQVHVAQRVHLDRATWIAYAHRNLKNTSTKAGSRSTRDVTCALPYAHAKARLCLIIGGPTHPRPPARLRTVLGGYYDPLATAAGSHRKYGCFGAASVDQDCSGVTNPNDISSHS